MAKRWSWCLGGDGVFLSDGDGYAARSKLLMEACAQDGASRVSRPLSVSDLGWWDLEEISGHYALDLANERSFR